MFIGSISIIAAALAIGAAAASAKVMPAIR
jgi:hypothetical protein